MKIKDIEITVVGKQFGYNEEGDYWYYVVRVSSRSKDIAKCIHIKEGEITQDMLLNFTRGVVGIINK